MYSKTQLAYKWLRYYVPASNARGHGIHSPFVYDFVEAVLNDKRSYYAYGKIEQVKKMLLLDERMLTCHDLGGGSLRKVDKFKKVSKIAGTAVCTQKFGRLLFRLANHYPSRTIVELGSSLGISASYMASADSSSNIVTMEGTPDIAGIAKETFHRLGLENITLASGNFNDILDAVLTANPPADLVFIDGNHRKKPVLEYFEKFLNKISSSSLIIIHDIHWSREMEEAWDAIQQHPKVKMSIDIFSAGLVFFREEFQVKQRFSIRF
jgi:predicted O-methyltransferase YrrM